MTHAKISDDKKTIIVNTQKPELNINSAIEAAEAALNREFGFNSGLKRGAWTIISDSEFHYEIENFGK